MGQVARLRRSSDRSTMMTPVPLNHRFRAPIFSIRSVLVISLLRALIVTVIGLPVTSVRPGRTVASVRAAHSLGEPFSRNPSSIPSPPSSSQSSQLPSLTAAVVIGFAIGCLPSCMVADATARRIATSWAMRMSEATSGESRRLTLM